VLQLEVLVTGPLETNVYLVWDHETREAALIDPGMDAEAAADAALRLRVIPKYIVNTHCHFDHSWLNAHFRRLWNVPLLYHELDQPVLERCPEAAQSYGFPGPEPSPPADFYLAEGDVLGLGSEKLTVLHLPGHTPGHIALVTARGVFSGDVLFAGSVGRWDFPGGSREALINSIQSKLMVLPAETVIYPGHGPATTIVAEAKENPFLSGEEPLF